MWEIAKSIFIFVLAGLCEIGGGYLVWLWLKKGESFWFGASGAGLLVLYGVVATWQTANFGRVYAAYGGIFVVMAIVWGWQIDKTTPDFFDVAGGLIVLIGTFVIMFAPRG